MPGIPARRFSLSEYFGVHRQGSLTSETGGSSEMIAQKKSSITEVRTAD
jgi:hypothetical protein